MILRKPIVMPPTRRLSALALMLCLAGLLLPAAQTDAKRKPAYRPQPDLKILSVTPSPAPYNPRFGSLDLVIEVELPRDLPDATLLEVSSLISSPSKRSFRFLSLRQPVGQQTGPSPAANDPASVRPLPRTSVTLSWDGTDQNREVVAQGRYDYEVRAKLLGEGDNGPRTHMVSWPKRGKLEVK